MSPSLAWEPLAVTTRGSIANYRMRAACASWAWSTPILRGPML